MIIDKETGDIIFGENQILKARMSVEEIKASKLMELVTEKGVKDLEEGYYTYFKIPNAHGHTIHMSVDMYEGKVSRIYITLEEFFSYYDNSYGNVQEYYKLLDKQREFLGKILQIFSVANEIDFNWGYIQFRSDYRDMMNAQIAIHYVDLSEC